MVEVNQDKLNFLVTAGFNEDLAKEALSQCNNDEERAVNWIMEHQDDSTAQDTSHQDVESRSEADFISSQPSSSQVVPYDQNNHTDSAPRAGAAASGNSGGDAELEEAIKASLQENQKPKPQESKPSSQSSSHPQSQPQDDEMTIAIQQSLLANASQSSVDKLQKRDPQLPVGMLNIGNTCYVNSLLQSFFMLPEFRGAVLNFDVRYISQLIARAHHALVQMPPEPTQPSSSSDYDEDRENEHQSQNNTDSSNKESEEQNSAPKSQDQLFLQKAETIVEKMKKLQELFAFLSMSTKSYIDPSDSVTSILKQNDGTMVQLGNQEDLHEFNSFFLNTVEDALCMDQYLNHFIQRISKQSEERQHHIQNQNQNQNNNNLLNENQNQNNTVDIDHNRTTSLQASLKRHIPGLNRHSGSTSTSEDNHTNNNYPNETSEPSTSSLSSFSSSEHHKQGSSSLASWIPRRRSRTHKNSSHHSSSSRETSDTEDIPPEDPSNHQSSQQPKSNNERRDAVREIRTTTMSREEQQQDLALGEGAVAFSPSGDSAAFDGWNDDDGMSSSTASSRATSPSTEPSNALGSLKPRKRLLGHRDMVTNCSFSTTGTLLASSSLDTTVRVWDLENNQEGVYDCGAPVLSLDILERKSDKLLLCGLNNGQIRMFKTGSSTCVGEFIQDRFPRNISVVACSPTKPFCAVSAWEEVAESKVRIAVLCVLHLNQWRIERSFHVPPDGTIINSIVFNHNGSMMLTAASDGCLRLFDVTSSHPIMGWKAHHGEALCARFDNDEATILSSGSDGRVIRWSAHREAEVLKEYKMPQRALSEEQQQEQEQVEPNKEDRMSRRKDEEEEETGAWNQDYYKSPFEERMTRVLNHSGPYRNQTISLSATGRNFVVAPSGMVYSVEQEHPTHVWRTAKINCGEWHPVDNIIAVGCNSDVFLLTL
eukprot:gb/GECH01012893.1/.p1 GENE.gb/GECH01012893.1/~~gb/GECH01012893.1/.p1  ORF type:complete len:934 (+),score=300.44 gb/GECH01012893.1/:1-2802(+)